MLEPLGWKYYFALLLLLSHFSRVRLCVTPQTAADQAPLSLGFSRQEYTVWIIKKVDTVPAWAALEGFAFQLERQESHQISGAAKD